MKILLKAHHGASGGRREVGVKGDAVSRGQQTAGSRDNRKDTKIGRELIDILL